MWCRHHLLFEVERPPKPDGHARTAAEGAPLVLNAPLPKGSRRRRHLQANAAAELVRVWIDDGLERWQSMAYTCSLDRADDAVRLRLGRASLREIGELRGLSRAQVKRELASARRSLARRGRREERGHVQRAQLGTPPPAPHAIVRIEREAPAPKVPTASDIFVGDW